MSKIPNYFFEKEAQSRVEDDKNIDYKETNFEVKKFDDTVFVGNEQAIIDFFNSLPMSFVQAIAQEGYSVQEYVWNYMYM